MLSHRINFVDTVLIRFINDCSCATRKQTRSGFFERSQIPTGSHYFSPPHFFFHDEKGVFFFFNYIFQSKWAIYFANYVQCNVKSLLKKPLIFSLGSALLTLKHLGIYVKIDLTSETTSWDMSLCMAARHSWVIFGSFVPQPMRKGWTTSELFSFNAFEKRYGNSQF